MSTIRGQPLAASVGRRLGSRIGMTTGPEPQPTWLTDWITDSPYKWQSVERIDGRWKLTAATNFTADLIGPGKGAPESELWVVVLERAGVGTGWPKGTRFSVTGNNPEITFKSHAEGIECYGRGKFKCGTARLDQPMFIPEVIETVFDLVVQQLQHVMENVEAATSKAQLAGVLIAREEK